MSDQSHPDDASEVPVDRDTLLVSVQGARAGEHALRSRVDRLALGVGIGIVVLGSFALWIAASHDGGDGSGAAAIYASFWVLWLIAVVTVAVAGRALVFVAAASRLRTARSNTARAESALNVWDSAAHYGPKDAHGRGVAIQR